MTKALRILQKVLVNYFYMVNAGLFLFVFLVLFGLPYSPIAFHLSLISGIIQSQVFISIVILCWVLYNLKCINYIVKQISHYRQSFLFCLNGFAVKKVYLCMLYVHTLVYMPVLLYAVAIVRQAFKHQQYLCAFEVIMANVIIVMLTPFLYVAAVQKKRLGVSGSYSLININISKPLFLFPLFFLLLQRKQMLIITKISSLLLLYGFIQLYEPERYDVRPLQLLLLLTAAFHCAVVYEIRSFEQEYLDFTKNLPFTTAGSFLRMLSMYNCLLLPEFLFLFKGIGHHFLINDYPALLLLTIGLVCMFHTMLLLENTTMEQFMRMVFGILAGCFFIILYDPGMLLPAAIVLLSFAFYNTYYYAHEKKSN